jgi:hypothetical protein
MAMVGHRTQSVYSRYAIADEGMLKDASTKLSAPHHGETKAARKVVGIGKIKMRRRECCRRSLDSSVR